MDAYVDILKSAAKSALNVRVDPDKAAKYAAVAIPLALAAVPVYVGGKLMLSVAKARAIERRLTSAPNNLPHDEEHSHPFFGLAEEFGKKSVTRVLQDLHDRLGPVVVWRVMGRISVSVADPKMAQLIIGKLNLPKNDYDAVRELLGDSLLTTNGEVWHKKRRSVNPAFRVSFLQNVVVPAVAERTNTMMDVLFPTNPEGGSIDLMQAMSKITLDVIGLAGFDYDFGFASSPEGNERLSAMVLNVLEEPNLRSFNPFRRFVKIREAIQYSRDLHDFKALGLKVIREARERKRREGGGVSPTSILGLLLESDMTEQELLNEVVTFLFAGHETSASTLTFMFILLDMHKDKKAKLQEEVEEVLGGRVPTFEDLPKLRYLNAVLKETLRFFPIGWATARRTTEETKIGDYTFPANTPFLVDYIALHRNPQIWDRALEFVPERWLNAGAAGETASEGVDASSTGTVPYSYLPFSGGLRSCIGKPFAELEIKMLVAMVVQRYDWRLIQPKEWEGRPFYDLYKDGTTLRPLPHNVWVTPRN